jgi:predicted RNA binding protein YcfA (HicA-like mRNA interferase family)
MKRTQLLKHLEAHGCRFVREGSKHTIYANTQDVTTSIPRHNEIPDLLAKKICQQLGIPPVK